MSAYDSMTYEEFGRRFFEIAVTEERVAAAIGQIAGEEFTMGPMAQGPGKFAKVTATVNVQDPAVTRHQGEQLTFDIQIPLEIELIIDLRIDKPRFKVFGEIALHATAIAAHPLALILDVHKPRPTDISIHITSSTLRAELVRIVGGVDAEIKRFISQHVSGEIDSPQSAKAKVIDIGGQIAEVWTGI
ncbi:hypothetical protein [Mycobacterium sp. NPDC006124]|uniref:hypothetical protein n=1 Tax=Mycobacterium sp. NPDC006124 TaxID=3156729 RepID=UPI0033B6142C